MGGKNPLSLGIVGCGDVVRLYFPMLKDMAYKNELTISCVCDTEKEKALAAQQWIEAPRVYTDVEDLLKDDTTISS